MAQSTERVQFRLDRDRREKLREVVEARGVSLSEWLRAEIDRSYEDELARRRMEAVESMSRLEIEDVPDMKTLKRQIVSGHDVPDLY